MANKWLGLALFAVSLLGLDRLYAETAPYNSSDLNIDFEEDSAPKLNVSDPLQKFNRPMDRFNRWLLRTVRPVTNAYERKVPQGARTGIGNFFSNLTAPLDIVNCGLQGKGKKCLQQTGRFLFNSTVGLAGIFDVSRSELKIPHHKEDFGQTLGHYGVKPGPYLNVPFLGPSTTRDLICLPLDWSLDLDMWLFPHNPPVGYGLTGVEVTNKTTQIQKQLISVEKDSLDPYTYVRDAFWQMREAKVKE